MSQGSNCPREELLALLRADALSPSEEAELRAHLASCPTCREARDGNEAVASALRALPAPVPSQAARDRAYGAVLEAMKRSKGGEAKGALAPAARARRPSLRILAPLVAAAACVFVVAGLLVNGSRESAERSATIAKAPAPEAVTGDRAGEPTALARAENKARGPLAEEKDAAPAQPRPAETPAPGGLAPPPRPVPAPAKESPATVVADTDVPPAAQGPRREASRDDESKGSVSRRFTPIDRDAALSVAREIVLEDEYKKQLEGRTPQAAGSRARPSSPDDGGAPAPPKSKETEAGKMSGDEKSADAFSKRKKNDALKKTASEPAEPKAGPAPRDKVEGDAFLDADHPDQLVVLAHDGAAYRVGRSGDESPVVDLAAVASRALVRLEDARERERFLAILDAELARTPHDVAWARRSLALAKALGIRPKPADAALERDKVEEAPSRAK